MTAREPRNSFGRVAEIYERARPTYPPNLFADLLAMLPTRPRVLEVGAGTGKATRDLLERGAAVVAIEIDPNMAGVMQRVLRSDDLIITVGDFEVVPTEWHAYDCVFSATAYHWISPRAQLSRPAQLLRPAGLLAVVDLIQVDSPDDQGFFAAAQSIYERHGAGHTGSPAPKREHAEPPMSASLQGDTRFTTAEVRRYDWNQTYTSAQYHELMLSYSTTQMMEPAVRRRLLDDMRAFIEQEFDGTVTRPLVATLTTAALSA